MTTTDYPPPVDKLLTLGDARDSMSHWPDYLAYGLGPEHIPDLIRMATDKELYVAGSGSLEVWAPVHAGRALGQLHAESAVEPLIGLLHNDDRHDDWVREQLPVVFGLIGTVAIPALVAYLADSSHGQYARGAAAHSLEKIAQQHPDARAECVAALSRQLDRFADNSLALNGFIVGHLLDLKAVEAAPAMERAFAAGRVELVVAGDWEDVQIELGLQQERATPKPHYLADSLGPELSAKLADLSQRIQIVEPQFQPKRKAKKRDKRKPQEPRSKKSRKK